MAEIDVRKVHKGIAGYFDTNNLNYSLTDKVRIDLLIRKYAPCYSRDQHSSKVCEQDLAVVLFDYYLSLYHGVSLFVRGAGGGWVLEPEESQIVKINEEDRRIEELDPRRYR